MKLAIFGSRTLKDKKTIELLIAEIERLNPDYIITSGETLGVCEVARVLAREKSIPLKLYWLDEKRCQGKYHWRSIGVLTECDSCLFLHDGESKGTLNEIEECKKLGREVIYHCLKSE